MTGASGERAPTPSVARHLTRALAVALVCAASGARPASAQSNAPTPPPIPDLDIDPTEQIDVKGWWSNGRELLLIQADGGYRLWKGTNRFLAPDDIGRWDRQTYRTLWLETYRGQKHSRDRAHLRRESGTLLLTVRDLQPMQQLQRPPHTREDTMVGSWSGPPGTLQLRGDGTYTFAASKADPKDRQPIRLGSHSGTWLVRDDTLVLSQGERTKPVVAPIVLPVPVPSVPAAASSSGAARTVPPTTAPSPSGAAPPALAPAANGGGATSPLPHQMLAPEGTTIALPGGELRREAPGDPPAR